MSHIKDLTGQRFGRLIVVERAGSNKYGAIWRCLCDCGNYANVGGTALRGGHTHSCGCEKKEMSAKRMFEIRTTHGKSYSRIYNIWNKIKDRCYNQKNQAYKRYGGRGIAVCDEWLHDFQVFYDWAIPNGYNDTLSIDRIDNDRGYSPDNCRWATAKEQANNFSGNHIVAFNGSSRNVTQWCEELQISRNTVCGRIRRGWTIEEALGLIPRNK